MRYKIVIFFCFVFVLFLTAITVAGASRSPKQKITIGLIGKSAKNDVFIAMNTGARVAAKELGAKYNLDIEIDWQTPNVDNVQEQAAAIERFTGNGAAGIAVSCVDANYLTPVINKAIDKGVPVMCFDSDAPKSKRFAYYGASDIDFGRMLLKELAAAIDGKGSIAILAGNKNALNLQRRLQGIKDELKKYPGISLAPEDVYFNLEVPEVASSTVDRAQKKHPSIKGWIFIGSIVLQVKNNLKWSPGEVKAVAGNAIPAELEYVKSGYVQGLVGVNCFQIGYKTVEIMLDKIRNNHAPADPLIYIPLTSVSKSNVDEWQLNWRKWLLKEAVSE